jgi:hypothetical protein
MAIKLVTEVVILREISTLTVTFMEFKTVTGLFMQKYWKLAWEKAKGG